MFAKYFSIQKTNRIFEMGGKTMKTKRTDLLDTINQFFNFEYEIEQWLQDTYVWVQAGLCNPMVDLRKVEIGHTFSTLITQIRLADTIREKANIPIIPRKKLFPLKNNYYNEVDRNALKEIDSAAYLSIFFSYQNVQDWIKTMDKLLNGMSYCKPIHLCDHFGNEGIVIQNLIQMSQQALVSIFLNQGIHVALPDLIIPFPKKKIGRKKLPYMKEESPSYLSLRHRYTNFSVHL